MNEVHQDRALTTDVDWFGGALAPLREGKPVALTMILPEKKSPVKRVIQQGPKIVTIVPGELFGAPKRTFVVSVVNNGSCFVEIDCNHALRLVLAGIPAALARTLLMQLRSTLKEENHGNSTTPSSTRRKKRASAGATGWKGRPPSVSIVTRSAYTSTRRAK